MKYENLEEAKAICEDIEQTNGILDKLERGPILVGIKYPFERLFLVIPCDGDGRECDMAREFITNLKDLYSMKVTKLKERLSAL